MKVGYIRVSTVEQNPVRQEILMKELGVDKVYEDVASGKNTARPALNEMLGFLREGDTVVVESISRFARSSRDFLNLLDILKEKGANFISHTENFDSTTPTGEFVLTMFAAVAQLERTNILERQRQGIEAAKSRGVYAGRGKKTYNIELWGKFYPDYKSDKLSAKDFMALLGLKRDTFYRRLREYEVSGDGK